ncbi:MAG: porphobilinogen deaminase, chloroplastic-like [Alphaproteobacteria bacterium]|nr:porphobilinogen deaminase, chloroplastic-like [Alphaproteobacteria bacterium]
MASEGYVRGKTLLAPDPWPLIPATPLRIGTRGSPLALIQAQITLQALQKAFPNDPAVQNATIIPITTTGDRLKDQPLFDIGGKGLFAKELEQALQAQEIDFAVHSLKDMEANLHPAMMLREDARDAMLSTKAPTLNTLPPGSVVGTCAPRRVAQILHRRPDLTCVPLRGNVDTRIQKLQEEKMDAIILALAGLRRLDRQGEVTYIFPESEMLPAVGQGAITLECRKDDARTRAYLAPLNHEDTERRVTAERALLAALDGNCRTPIGGHATIQEDGRLRLEALIAAPSGTPLYRTAQVGDDPVPLGISVAKKLINLAGPGFRGPSCIS